MESNQKKTKQEDGKEPKSRKKIIYAVIMISIAFLGSFLLYFILQITLNTETPIVVVESGSMEPVISRGDLLIVRGVPPSEIRNGTIEDKTGDIIVFDAHGVWSSPPDEPIVHRVVDKKFEGGIWQFRTKGDANYIIDEGWVPQNNIYGIVVFKIPLLGWVKIFLTESGLLIPLLIFISILLVVSIIIDIYKKEETTDKKDLKTEENKNQINNLE